MLWAIVQTKALTLSVATVGKSTIITAYANPSLPYDYAIAKQSTKADSTSFESSNGYFRSRLVHLRYCSSTVATARVPLWKKCSDYCEARSSLVSSDASSLSQYESN